MIIDKTRKLKLSFVLRTQRASLVNMEFYIFSPAFCFTASITISLAD